MLHTAGPYHKETMQEVRNNPNRYAPYRKVKLVKGEPIFGQKLNENVEFHIEQRGENVRLVVKGKATLPVTVDMVLSNADAEALGFMFTHSAAQGRATV